MKHIMMILVSALLALTATARNDWYDTPLTLNTGKMPLDTIPAYPDDVMVHLRLAGADKGKGAWSLIWGRTDIDDCIVAHVTMPERRSHDNLYPALVYVDVYQRVMGEDTPITSTNFKVEDEFFSLKLIYDGFCTRLFAGDKEKKLLAELPLDLSKPTPVLLDAQTDLEARRISVMYNVGNTPARDDCPDAKTLALALAGKSGIEGIWVYLDRDIDTHKASLGHKYSLAITKADDSTTYQIISIDATEASRGFIKPIQVKGWMRPTNFNNNYDMVWYDTKGRELNDDNNAQLSDDGSILTLRFPVYKSQLRFTRPR